MIKNSIPFCFLILFVVTFSCSPASQTPPSENGADWEILDGNSDGIINPYEALDALLVLQKENGKELTTKDISQLAAVLKAEEEAEMEEMLEELDTNQDGTLELKEIEGEMQDIGEMMDANTDGIVSLEEMSTFNFEDALLADEAEINERIEALFAEYKASNEIQLKDVPEKKRGRYSGWDANRDEKITKEEVFAFMMADNTPVTFKVKGKTAFMKGVITAELPQTVLELLFEHPEVDTIEMTIVPGSIDDHANLRAGLYVNKMGLTTKLNAQSSVASGGTDFFLCGKSRIVEKGALLGVHSWGGGAIPATEVPKDDPVHQKYLDFYEAVEVPASFYWYTLEAAPAEDMHIMTEEEIEKYQVRKSN